MSNYLLPSPDDDDYLALSEEEAKLYPDQQGKLYRKQIFKMNSHFIHPSNPKVKIKTDKTFAEKLSQNFKSTGNIVQLPLCNDKNEHVEGPDKNLGRVLDVEYNDKGVYAIIDARKNAEDFGKTFLGSSAFVDLNWTDKQTGEGVGPTLLHVAVTNRPYLTNLDEYSEVTKLSADNNDEEPVLLTLSEEENKPNQEAQREAEQPRDNEEETSMDITSVTAWLKEQGLEPVKSVEYAELQSRANEAAKLSETLAETSTKLQLSETEKLSVEKVAEALVELSDANESLSTEVETLKKDRDELKLSAATLEIDDYVRKGRILPAQKEPMLKLYLSDRDTFDALLPSEPLVSLTEEGVTVHEDRKTVGLSEDDRNRYRELAARLNTGKR